MAYCDEYLELINASIDGALFPAEQARLEEHLAQCPDCKALYNDLRRIHLTLQSLPNLKAPEGLTDRVMAAVKADNVIPMPVKKPALQWKRWAATAAAVALILAGAGGLGLLSGRDAMTPAPKAVDAPESADPTRGRSLPEGVRTTPVAPVPTNDAPAGTEDTPNTTVDEDQATQGSLSPSTADPTRDGTQVPTVSTETIAPMSIPIPPAESPQEGEENPTGSLMTGPLGQMPIIPVPPTSGGQEGPSSEVSPMGLQGISLEPEMTEGALAAMDQVRHSLEVPDDYVWENGTTALWTDSVWEFHLVYMGLDPDGQHYQFTLYQSLLSEEESHGELFPMNSYAVPVEGGGVLIRPVVEAETEAEGHDHHG